MRTVRTAPGARAVQIVRGSRRGVRDIEHLGSAHDEQELEVLKAAARQRLAGGQGELDLGLDVGVAGELVWPVRTARHELASSPARRQVRTRSASPARSVWDSVISVAPASR